MTVAQGALDLAPGVDRLGVPCRLRQEKLQPLHFGRLGLHQRLGVGQRRQDLGPLTRQQQPAQIGAETLSLRQRLEQRIKLRHIGSNGPSAGGHERRADMMSNIPDVGRQVQSWFNKLPLDSLHLHTELPSIKAVKIIPYFFVSIFCEPEAYGII